MPLIKSAKKSAVGENIKTEMGAGKPQKQSIAIALNVQRKAKKKAPRKMAEGGGTGTYDNDTPSDSFFKASDSVANAVGPAKGVSGIINKGIKALPALASMAADGGKVQSEPSPKPVSTDYSQAGDKEKQVRDAIAGAFKAKGGMIAHKHGPDCYNMGGMRCGMSEGGEVELSAADERRPMPDEEFADESQDSRVEIKAPGEDSWTDRPTERQAARGSNPKQSPNSEWTGREPLESQAAEGSHPSQPRRKDGIDMEDEHSNGRKPYARGGNVTLDESEMEPDEMRDEDTMQTPDIVEAIMGKRRVMAKGGILSEDSIYSDDSDQADVSRNADEDANMEDRSSYDALRKENYSESDGLDALDSPRDSNEHGHELSDEDSHDMVDVIRRKMMAKRKMMR